MFRIVGGFSNNNGLVESGSDVSKNISQDAMKGRWLGGSVRSGSGLSPE